jgi:hypothetical protein
MELHRVEFITVWIYHGLFIASQVDENLSCLHYFGGYK